MRLSTIIISIVIMGLHLFVIGCGEANEEPRTVLEFQKPMIFLHVREKPETVQNTIRANGCRIATREDLGNANADFVISGTGMVSWGDNDIVVDKDGIRVNNMPVKSSPSGLSRNVLLKPNGDVEKDAALSFEAIVHPKSAGELE